MGGETGIVGIGDREGREEAEGKKQAHASKTSNANAMWCAGDACMKF